MLPHLVDYSLDSKENVRRLMAQVDVDLTSLGICTQSRNASENRLNDASKKAIQALSKVNDAFQRALQNNTRPRPTVVPPTPYEGHVIAVINQTAKEVLAKFKPQLDPKGWSGREELHEKIVHNTVDALSKNMRQVETVGYVFNALAYLPYNRVDQHCLLPKNKSVDVGYRNLNFFVLYASAKRNAERACKDVKNRTAARVAVLDHVFAQSDGDLCKRLEAALSDQKVNINAFGGIAAVRCGYEFVWYELGYTYFHAAESSTPYKWEKKGGAYDSKAKCGQIFFFP
ncbi:hypothetical protein AAVH_28489 [Aphelenchoides avenae]|nr:hypothetical protein AAVH_28489 [Aphelenchus avenae]